MYYADYLQLDKLLDSQTLESKKQDHLVHDEMLFIITHQAYELWFKQILYDVDSILAIFSHDYVDNCAILTAVDRLKRITKIFHLLIEQINILETMTPMDFLEFRDFLVPSSGFQSFQFRLLENKLGIERRVGQEYLNRLSKPHQNIVKQAEKQASLFAGVEKWLARTPFLEFEGFSFWENYQQAVMQMFKHDKQTIQQNSVLTPAEKKQEITQLNQNIKKFNVLLDEKQYQQEQPLRLSFRAASAALLIFLYRNQPIFHLPYQLLTSLIDIDELFTQWRERHAIMVIRMIGTKIGTGGSSGYEYLKKAILENRIFDDFAKLSTFLVKRSALPELPKDYLEKFGFSYQPIGK